MTDFNHYFAIQQRRRLHEVELVGATGPKKAHHEHNIRMIDKELAGEIKFLKSKGVDTSTLTATVDDISDEELLKVLGA